MVYSKLYYSQNYNNIVYFSWGGRAKHEFCYLIYTITVIVMKNLQNCVEKNQTNDIIFLAQSLTSWESYAAMFTKIAAQFLAP